METGKNGIDRDFNILQQLQTIKIKEKTTSKVEVKVNNFPMLIRSTTEDADDVLYFFKVKRLALSMQNADNEN